MMQITANAIFSNALCSGRLLSRPAAVRITKLQQRNNDAFSHLGSPPSARCGSPHPTQNTAPQSPSQYSGGKMVHALRKQMCTAAVAQLLAK